MVSVSRDAVPGTGSAQATNHVWQNHAVHPIHFDLENTPILHFDMEILQSYDFHSC